MSEKLTELKFGEIIGSDLNRKIPLADCMIGLDIIKKYLSECYIVKGDNYIYCSHILDLIGGGITIKETKQLHKMGWFMDIDDALVIQLQK